MSGPERASVAAVDAHLLVVAKAPVPGRVKTRLVPPYSHAEAARLAEAALGDTLAAVAAVPGIARTLLLDGEPGPWLPAGFAVVRQRGGGLDERLAAGFDDAWQLAPGIPQLLIGMDTPQLGAALLTESVRRLLTDGVDAVFGPAADGGWWALGLRRPDPALVLGVAMSTATTGRRQRDRLIGAGLTVVDLPELVDVDDAASAALVAARAPETGFAAALEACAVTA